MLKFRRIRSFARYYLPKYTVPEQVTSIAQNSSQALAGHVSVTLFVMLQLYGTIQFAAAVPWALLCSWAQFLLSYCSENLMS
jgi:hypothetical protein